MSLKLKHKRDVREIRRLVVAAMFALITSHAHAQFEGIVESKNMTTDQLSMPREFVMTMWIKKEMVKIETKGEAMPGTTMIYRTDLRRIWMLNSDDKSYFEISQDETPQEMIASGGTTARYSIKKTGKTKTIAGYKCEQFIIRRDGEETQLWGTKKLNHLVSTLSKALRQENTDVAEGVTAEVMKLGVFPLSSSTKIDGILVESQEVTKVEMRSLDPGLFSLPAGYTKQKSVDMMQGGEERHE